MSGMAMAFAVRSGTTAKFYDWIVNRQPSTRGGFTIGQYKHMMASFGVTKLTLYCHDTGPGQAEMVVVYWEAGDPTAVRDKILNSMLPLAMWSNQCLHTHGLLQIAIQNPSAAVTSFAVLP